tara:strand:- start:144 stop:404 length:261 start_codon:yes stop_codon:yes gene_type:complete
MTREDNCCCWVSVENVEVIKVSGTHPLLSVRLSSGRDVFVAAQAIASFSEVQFSSVVGQRGRLIITLQHALNLELVKGITIQGSLG